MLYVDAPIRAPGWVTDETGRFAEVLSSIPALWSEMARHDGGYMLPDLSDNAGIRQVFETILLDQLDDRMLTEALDFVGDFGRIDWLQLALTFYPLFRSA